MKTISLFSGNQVARVSNYAKDFHKVLDVADCLQARAYKGFGKQADNGVIECEIDNDKK